MARQRLDAQESRNRILDAVESLMRREGHARVNTRTVALEAGLKPTLVHYHFDTTENLILEAYRRAAIRNEERLQEILTSERPLRALWNFNSDPVRTELATEFIALAVHHPAICAELRSNVVRFREMQNIALARSLKSAALQESGVSPAAIAMIIAAIGRAFVIESAIGVSNGHDEVRSIFEKLIENLE